MYQILKLITFLVLIFLGELCVGVADDVKIVGGYVAPKYSFPWVVCIYRSAYSRSKNNLIKYYRRFNVFHGAVVTRNVLLSTCVPLLLTTLRPFKIRGGHTKLSSGQIGWSSSTLTHPNCSQINGLGPYIYDYSVIKVAGSGFDFTRSLKPIPFPKDLYNSYNILEKFARLEAVCTVGSWGSSGEKGVKEGGQLSRQPKHLHLVDVNVMINRHCQMILCKASNDYCEMGIEDKVFLESQNKFCIRTFGVPSAYWSRGLCLGDLGSTVTCNDAVYGLVSQRFDCGRPREYYSTPIVVSHILEAYQWLRTFLPSLPPVVPLPDSDDDDADDDEGNATTHKRQWFTATLPTQAPSRSIMTAPATITIITTILIKI